MPADVLKARYKATRIRIDSIGDTRMRVLELRKELVTVRVPYCVDSEEPSYLHDAGPPTMMLVGFPSLGWLVRLRPRSPRSALELAGL